MPPEKAVSPIIGVILIVALTVALITLVTLIVFNTSSTVKETSDITVQVTGDNEELNVNVIRNENVDKLKIIRPDGTKEDVSSNVGTSETISLEEEGSYSVVAVLEDGSEETIRTEHVSVIDDTTLTGEVSTNPKISNAIVEAYDSTGDLIAETETNEDGIYELDIDYNKENTDIVVSVEGFEHEELENPLYAGASKNADAQTVDFRFESDNFIQEYDAGGDIISVSNGLNQTDKRTIANVEQLQSIEDNIDEEYEIVRDIDASETSEWNGGKGFKPIGEEDTEFRGVLDGQDNTITNLHINRPDEDYVGLFGESKDMEIKNIHTINSNINGDEYVGSLTGRNSGGGEIQNIHVDSSLESNSGNVGGIVGSNAGLIYNSSSTADIESDGMNTGGLAGIHSEGVIQNTYSKGSITGTENVGGIGGWNIYGDVINSYSINDINGNTDVGGLIGRMGEPFITTDEVKLVDSYVSETDLNEEDKVIGDVAGSNVIVEQNDKKIIEGEGSSEDLKDVLNDEFVKTDVEIKNSEDNFESFDFDNVWVEGDSYPLLR